MNFFTKNRPLFFWFLFSCYVAIAGFSPVLHNHDLEWDHHEKDCSACQWSQSNSSLASQGSGLPAIFHQTYALNFSSQASEQKFALRLSSRDPPSSLFI